MIKTKIYFITLFITLTLTFLLTKLLIPILKKRKIGQKILDIGPSWHKSKEGTPTMGGLGFVIASIFAFIVVLLVFFDKMEKRELFSIINVFAYGILNCMVGIIDDIAKIKKAKNEGLSPRGKLMLQAIFAVAFLISMAATVGISTCIKIPFLNKELNVGYIYYIFSFLLLCGVVNAVNLTDGVDGLASTCVLTIGLFFSFTAFMKYNDSLALVFFGAILTGSTLGFLIFNLHPAKIFMGDTGSLFFGGIVVGVSFAIDNPLIVLIYGFIFICEAATDILQVVYFKLTKGKRLFKMAPLHHHLEKSGYSEIKIVSIFGIVNAVFCIVAFLGLT